MTKRPRGRAAGRSPGRSPTRGPESPAPGAAAAPSSRARTLLLGAAVFACASAVFWPSVGYSFLNWDDNVYILQNPWIRALTWSNVRGVFTQPYFQNYLPLHLLSYMFDHALWGLKAGGYHLTSVVLHGVNSVLCLAVVRRMGGSLAVAFVAALLFAVHPSHVEAVAWVSSRKEVLSTTFMLLSLLFYARTWNRGALHPAPYLASILFFLLAMLSKVSVVVLPAFLLLLDWSPEPRASGGRPSLPGALASKIPYGIVGAVLIVVNSRAQVTAQAAYAHEPLRYLTVKGHAVWNYTALLFGLGGSPDYDLPRFAGAASVILQLGGLLALPLAGYLLIRWKRRLEFLGVCWVFLTLLPAIVFPLVTYMADRYLYAPSLGFSWALAAGLVGMAAPRSASAGDPRRAAPARFRAAAVAAIVLALAAGFSIRTLRYSSVWRNSEALWTYAITKSRDYRVFNNLAQVRMGQKRWDEAESLLRRGAVAENVTSHQSLGVLYYTQKKYGPALEETDRAIEIDRRKRRDPALTAELHFNRGAILWSLGRSQEAVAEWRSALREYPNHAQAREWLGIAAGSASPPPPAGSR